MSFAKRDTYIFSAKKIIHHRSYCVHFWWVLRISGLSLWQFTN